MTKTDILRAISKKTNFTLENCDIAYTAFIEILREAMMGDEEKILLSDFGTFRRRMRKARVCRNPQTDEKIQVPERVAYTFKISHKLNQAINDK